MQADPFNALEEFYLRLPEAQRVTALLLRGIIVETLPEVTEKMAWGAPFFNGARTICYLWLPAKKGKLKQTAIGLCFKYAPQIDTAGYLDMANRKLFGCRYFTGAEEVDVDEIVGLLERAWVLDGKYR